MIFVDDLINHRVTMQKKKLNFLFSPFVSSFHFLTIVLTHRIVIQSLNCDISRSIDKILSYQLTRIEQQLQLSLLSCTFRFDFHETEFFRDTCFPIFEASKKSKLDLLQKQFRRKHIRAKKFLSNNERKHWLGSLSD